MENTDTLPAILGRKLALILKIAFESRQHMADATGASPATVQAWCNGESYPNAHHLAVLFTMGVDVHWILDDDRTNIQGMFRNNENGEALMKKVYDEFLLVGNL
jgi:transcriptional regulator with XRE-family HTH domain